MKSFLREPLLHFLLIGALLFFIFESFGSSEEDNRKTITITTGQIEMLQNTFTRTWQRPPAPKELRGLINDKVRDEIAYLEATAMGLDKEDPYIRRRLRMKMELLIEDLSSAVQPTNDELQAFLVENREKFREGAQIAFDHVFIDANSHPGTLDTDIEKLMSQLKTMDDDSTLENYGDAIMLPRTLSLTSTVVIDRQFGKGFAGEIIQLKPGIWLGPIQSSYGLHLVKVNETVPGYDPSLEEIRPTVERELMAQRREEMLTNTYERLQQQYFVHIEPLEEQQ